MAETEEELTKVKGESEKVGLKPIPWGKSQ